MECVFSFGDFTLQHLQHRNVLIPFDERWRGIAHKCFGNH